MSASIHIERVRARYRLPAADPEVVGRLDRLLGRVLEEGLPAALASVGVSRDETLCIRALRAPVRLDLGCSDTTLVARWSLAIARAARAALDDGSPRDLARYGSRRRALCDLIVSSARGESARRWAFLQLGLIGRSSDATTLAEAMAADPQGIGPVLTETARAGALPWLLRYMPPPLWGRVADAALEAIGRSLAALPFADRRGQERERAAAPAAPDVIRDSERLLRRSPMLRAALASAPSAQLQREALLAVALLEAEPLALRRPEAHLAPLLSLLDSWLAAGEAKEPPAAVWADPPAVERLLGAAAKAPRRDAAGSEVPADASAASGLPDSTAAASERVQSQGRHGASPIAEESALSGARRPAPGGKGCGEPEAVEWHAAEDQAQAAALRKEPEAAGLRSSQERAQPKRETEQPRDAQPATQMDPPRPDTDEHHPAPPRQGPTTDRTTAAGEAERAPIAPAPPRSTRLFQEELAGAAAGGDQAPSASMKEAPPVSQAPPMASAVNAEPASAPGAAAAASQPVSARGTTTVEGDSPLPRPTAARRPTAAVGASAASDAPDPLPSSVPQRALGRTQAGGLLFLLGLVRDLDLADALVEELPGRPLRFCLHHLARCLLALADDDPALLAFCGLRPTEPSPTEGEEPLTEEESARLAPMADRLIAALRARLSDQERSRRELLTWLCLRPAEIDADLGWFSVKMPSDRVETEIRRAGLDLDPGYLPFLGVVMVFLYV